MSAPKRVVPVLPARNVAESAEYYRHLGFNVVTPMEDYAILERDSAELHLTQCADSALDKKGLYLVVEDVDALYGDLTARGFNLDPPVTQPWGLKENYLIDPGGNLIRFTQEAVIP